MSTKLIKVGNSFNVPQKTYICNTAEERDNLKAYFGDLCLVIEDGITYILNSENEWFVYPTGGGGGGNPEAIAPVYDPVETAYQINQLIMYDDKVWRAKQAIQAPANDFDESKWEQVDIASAKADLINGKVPQAQLPSYVDDVLEYASLSVFPRPGETGKIYVAIDTGYTYRWTGGDPGSYIAIGTIFNEVHIGTDAPTGDETIWIKPMNNTVDSKEVGDWLYLDETVNGVTSRVRFKVLSKDDTKAIIVREGTVTPGFKVDLDNVDLNDVIESIADGDYDSAIKAQYNSSISTNNNITVHPLTYYHSSVVNKDPLINAANFYSSVETTDVLILKAGPANDFTSYVQRLTSQNQPISHCSPNTLSGASQDYESINNLLFNVHGHTDVYIAVAFEIPLNISLTGLDELADPLANCIIKFKQNDQWNDVNDIHVATVEQLIALHDKIADLRTTTNTSLLGLDGRVTTLEGNQLPTLTAEDEGKVLTAGELGQWTLKKPVLFANLTKTTVNDEDVYTCDITPREIHEAFQSGIRVYINYMGVIVPVINTVYNEQDDEYYISATITTIIGEELIGRRIGFDGSVWSTDFTESFIVRGATTLDNIGKYLKATHTGIEWDTPGALEAEEMLEVLSETGLIETPGIEYTDYIEDPNGDYLYDNELGEWRLAEAGETGTHRAENCVLIYQDYVEDPNGTYLYDEELGEWRLAGDNETGTHSLGDAYILYY